MVDEAEDDEWLVGRVEKVDGADWRTDDASWVLVAVADGTWGDDEAWADAFMDEEELLVEDEAGDDDDDEDTSVDVKLACLVSTIVMDTETVVASGSSASVDLVTVW
jgi:serine/threonine protein phosphatase PrpC